MSRLPTLFFQRSLPRLPVPRLADSLRRLLVFLEPLVPAPVLQQAQRDAAAFAAGQGPRLQARLEREAATTLARSSFVNARWTASYLASRAPLPVFTTPQITLKDDGGAGDVRKMRQRARAADLAHAAAQFCLDLAAQRVPPEIIHTRPALTRRSVLETAVAALVPPRFAGLPYYALGAYPLDMSQYRRLFATTRVPKSGRDELVSAWAPWPPAATDNDESEGPAQAIGAAPPRHMLVLRGARTYAVDVIGAKGSDIEARLAAVVADADAMSASGADDELPVAALTGWGRAEWAAARAELGREQVNAASLAVCDSALFALTLDADAPEDRANVSRALLLGRGATTGRNRWFDKSVSLVVMANGRAGIAFEHSWGDGVAVLSLASHMHAQALKAVPRDAVPTSAGGWRRLPWRLSTSSARSVRAACAAADALAARLEVRVARSETLTRADCKRANASPDAVLQMALQLAHARAHPHYGARVAMLRAPPLAPSTYESASTAAFKHGRTETIRVASPESAALVQAFSSGPGNGAPLAERHAALRAAVARHKATSLAAVTGKGCDRHLSVLRDMALEEAGAEAETLPLFAGESWSTWSTIRISTSTLSSPALDGGGFGPVGPESYGVGYGITDEGSHFHVATFRDDTTTKGELLLAEIESALAEVRAAMLFRTP